MDACARLGTTRVYSALPVTSTPQPGDTYLTGLEYSLEYNPPVRVTAPKHRRSASEDPTRPHVRSPIPFDKQTPRPNSLHGPDVHPARFVRHNDSPSIASHVRRVQTPQLSKASGRDSTGLGKDYSNCPEYTLNYASVEKRVVTAVPFSRAGARRRRKSETLTSTIPHRTPSLEGVDPKVRSPTLDRDSSRPQHSAVPAFMLKATHRQGLKVVSFKTLEMNGYCSRDFGLPSSSFGPGWPLKKRFKPVQKRLDRVLQYMHKK